jgi:PhzF family phenazine biosynthesis protein
MSQAVVQGGRMITAGIVADDPVPSVAAQTAQVLAKIDRLLTGVGSSRSLLLKANVWLADIACFEEMNAVWDAWVVKGSAPARATVEARLAGPQYLVEIMVEAAVPAAGLHTYRIVNVFTVDGDRFTGNPLCVFEDARGLSEAQMQALARQMNLSETTFVLPSATADAQVRIFTPAFEMPFAGHPTLGTAAVVGGARERVTLEMKAGLVEVSRQGPSWTLRAARPPATRPAEATRDELARTLGLPAGAVSDEPLWVVTGVEQLVVPIATPELVRAARPVPELLLRHGYSQARGAAMAYLWSKGAPEWTVRFFFTADGAVREDPATGSACANLGGWHIARGGSLPLSATLRQGDAVGRPSRLGLRVAADGAIYVTGAVAELGRGTIDLT